MQIKVYYQKRRFCCICLKEITHRQGASKYCRECGEKVAVNMQKIYKMQEKFGPIKRFYIYGGSNEEGRNEENS